MKKGIWYTILISIAVVVIGYAAQTDWSNGDTGLVVRTAIQANDTEVYGFPTGSQSWTPTGIWSFLGLASLAMGPNNYTASVDPPDEEGLYHYQSGIAGFDASMLTHYSNGAVQYPVESPELPTTTGEYYAYNSVTNIMEVVSAGSLSITEQSGDPAFSGMSTGDLIVATGSGDMFYKSATGGYTIPGTYTVDAIIPGFTSAGVDGDQLTMVFDTPVTQGAGWLETLFTVDGTVTGTAIGMTVDSGNGTAQWVATLDTPMVETDVVTLDYPTTANGVESSTGDDLTALVAEAVTNNTSPLSCSGSGSIYAQTMEAIGFAPNGLYGDEIETVSGTGSVLDPDYTTDPICGTYSLRCYIEAGFGKSIVQSVPDAVSTEFYGGIKIRVNSLTIADGTEIVPFYSALDQNGRGIRYVFINTGGQLQVRFDFTNGTTFDWDVVDLAARTSNISTGVDYTFTSYYNSSGTSEGWEFRIDDVELDSALANTLGGPVVDPASGVFYGLDPSDSGTGELVIDEVYINDNWVAM